MKHIYYYIWVSLAFLHYRISKVLFTFNKMMFKIRKTSEAEQNKWKEDYNKGFLGFPGGMLDWAAFGLLLIFIFSIILILLISFDLETGLFKSKISLGSLLIVLTALVYYLIYFKNMPWLKDKIRMINKKYYL